MWSFFYTSFVPTLNDLTVLGIRMLNSNGFFPFNTVDAVVNRLVMITTTSVVEAIVVAIHVRGKVSWNKQETINDLWNKQEAMT